MNPFMRVLVVDDERISRQTTVAQLHDAGFGAKEAADADAGLRLLQSEAFDLVLTDLRMPGMNGLEFLAAIHQAFPAVDVLVMTAYGSVETAVAAMQGGAIDYLIKPFRFVELEIKLKRLMELRSSRQELMRLQSLFGDAPLGGLFGSSKPMRRARERIQIAAPHTAPVLVTGETGTGKEMAARAIHTLGERSEGPFVPLACGAIPQELAEAEIFGHERGAFTGAGSRHRGCFERASGGSLLLDDIDDLPLPIQSKLVRVLQEGSIVRVGGERSISVDVRIIATTKVDLSGAVAAGTFRDDLFYRLRGLEVALPPLRDRGEDLLLLTGHFLRGFAASPDQIKKLSPAAVTLLESHPWPGNVRELRRVIEAAVALCPTDLIEPSHLPDSLLVPDSSRSLYELHLEAHQQIDLPNLLRHIEEELLAWAMKRSGGKQTLAAKLLGIPRTSLQSKLGR